MSENIFYVKLDSNDQDIIQANTITASAGNPMYLYVGGG